MIRFAMAVHSVLLASSLVIAQEPQKQPPVAPPNLYSTTLEARFENYQNRLHEAIQAKTVAKLPTALETNFGLSLTDADDSLRAQLEIPGGEGVVVIGVKEKSLAEQAGLKLNDVLLKLGDQEAKAVDQVGQILLGLGKDALEVKLIREGKPRRMSLVGPEHGFPPEAAEFWIGVPVSPVDVTLRSHLPTLLDNTGLIANDVVKGSPADQAGVKKDDILVTMSGQPLPNADALIAQIQASKGKAVSLELLRAAKPLTLTITPAKRAHPTVINVRELTDAPLTYHVVQPSMAIALDLRNQATLTDQLRTHYGYYAAIPNTNHTTPTVTDPAIARIEGQLKEVMAKLEEIGKALEASKKPASK